MTGGTPPQLVIFDLDGTLVDTAPDIAWALNATLAEAGLPGHPLDVVKEQVGDGAAKLIERALPPGGAGHDLRSLLARFLARYQERLCVESHLYPGVRTLLDALASAGIPAAVITNKPGHLARGLLDQLDAGGGRWLAIAGDGDGFPRKPDPTAARALMGRVGAAAARTVVVGDGLPDIRLAHALGAPVIAAGWGYVSRARLEAEAPTHLADSVDDVRQVLLPS